MRRLRICFLSAPTALPPCVRPQTPIIRHRVNHWLEEYKQMRHNIFTLENYIQNLRKQSPLKYERDSEFLQEMLISH